ncbi:unnamed protein product [Alopecurus aequalis]
MAYFNETSAVVTTCPGTVDSYVRNLTSSYADKSNESSVVATSVFMLILAAGFFILNLFSRVSNTSAVLKPTARLLLCSVLSIFPSVMNYLFSEAKNAGGSSDLPVRARVILTWMLLGELLRKKVDAILLTAGEQQDKGYAVIIAHAATVAWLGYLVFFNIKGAGRVAVFGTIWVLCAAKFVQRVAFNEIGRRSLAYGKNARLLSAYMPQMLQARLRQHGAVQEPCEMLKTCDYVVMGEENLVVRPGPHGYQLDLDKVATDDNVVTVGKIWSLPEHPIFQSNPRIRRQCLSFALFKQLRRRFEHLPAMTKQETDHCRDLIFQGVLCCRKEKDPGPGVLLFQLLQDEISFLSEDRHSVHPVVFASPYFFLTNYLVFPAVVCGLCLMTIHLCGNGDMRVAYHSIHHDNYAISTGVFTLTTCLWKNFLTTPAAFFATIDISITYLLFLAFIYEEIWEFLVFVFSKWFMVSLLCTYTTRPRLLRSTASSGALRCLSWASTKHPNVVTMKQFSVLSFSWLSMTLPSAHLPKQAKDSIMECFRSAADNGLSNGRRMLDSAHSHLLFFCRSESVAEVILTWHIATSLLEMASVRKRGALRQTQVATRLSKYCAYLVAFHPELLPDDREGTERVFKDMKKDLKEALHCWCYYSASESARYTKMMAATPNKFLPDCQDVTLNVVQKGTMLGKALIEEDGKEDQESIWKLLADLWVELIVYVAPSSSDDHLKGQQEALVHGGELVSLLWALATHTGATRSPPTPVEDVEERSRP